MFLFRSTPPRTPPTPVPDSFLPDPNDAQAAQRAARNLAHCEQIIELGMQALRDTAQDMREARDPPPETPARTAQGPDLAARFATLARCVRQTMLLEAHIADERRTIVTKTLEIEKNRAFAATFNQNRVPQPTVERTEPLQREHFPLPQSSAEIPSLIACISKEMGVDLENKTVLDNVRGFRPVLVKEPAPD